MLSEGNHVSGTSATTQSSDLRIDISFFVNVIFLPCRAAIDAYYLSKFESPG